MDWLQSMDGKAQEYFPRWPIWSCTVSDATPRWWIWALLGHPTSAGSAWCDCCLYREVQNNQSPRAGFCKPGCACSTTAKVEALKQRCYVSGSWSRLQSCTRCPHRALWCRRTHREQIHPGHRPELVSPTGGDPKCFDDIVPQIPQTGLTRMADEQYQRQQPVTRVWQQSRAKPVSQQATDFRLTLEP